MSRTARTKLPKTLEKRVFQEGGSKCVFCPEKEVVSLQIHHIDGDPSHNTFENLIVVCASCHTKITAGVISDTQVRSKKRQLAEPDKRTSGAFSSSDEIFKGPWPQDPDRIDFDDTPVD